MRSNKKRLKMGLSSPRSPGQSQGHGEEGKEVNKDVEGHDHHEADTTSTANKNSSDVRNCDNSSENRNDAWGKGGGGGRRCEKAGKGGRKKRKKHQLALKFPSLKSGQALRRERGGKGRGGKREDRLEFQLKCFLASSFVHWVFEGLLVCHSTHSIVKH